MRFAAYGLLLLITASSARAQDWPEFRGPTGQGHAGKGSLPTEWSPEKNVAWKQEIPGSGWSSPILLAGRIYLTAAVPVEGSKDHSLRALCLDATKGTILWNVEVFHQDGATAPRIHGKNSHASPTPLTDGKRVYVHFGHQGTAALDFDGKIVWRNTELAYKPVHGNGGTPALVGSALIFSADGGDKQTVIALNRDDGKVLWQTPRKVTTPRKFAFSTPLLINVSKSEQLISPGPGFVGAYDPKTGEEIWRAGYGEGYSVIPRPVYGHGLVFVSSGYDQPIVVAVRPDGKGDVTKSHVAWTLQKGAPHTPSPLLVGDDLYLVSDKGLASCVDAKTGKIHWQERVAGGYSASPLFGDGKIYLQNEEGLGTVLKVGRQFEILARNDLGEKTLASYAVSDGALFIRTAKHLYRIQNR